MYSKLFFSLTQKVSDATPMATVTISDTRDYDGVCLTTPCNDQSDSQQPVIILGRIPDTLTCRVATSLHPKA